MSLPRIGFVGTGWIGRNRMQAMLESGSIEACAIVDSSPECAEEARKIAPDAVVLPSFDALFDQQLDGVVIATPSAMHAEQARAALEAGLAVFCQKPLGRSEEEVREVVDAARRAGRLLQVDLSYRLTQAAQAIANPIRGGELGEIFAADLVFHNAYGPDKPWFYERALSGGGCVMDLGVHLADLALFLLGYPEVEHVSSRLFAGGQPLSPTSGEVEDYAVARLDLAGGASIRLSCSWRLQAGQEAIIDASFYGTEGGTSLRNLGGSFYDFEALRYHGTRTETLCRPPDDWGGRTACQWASRLAQDRSFDPAAEQLVRLSSILDRIYTSSRL